MTTITAPIASIIFEALLPDVVRSCIVIQPSPPPELGSEPPDPVGDTGIYTPVPDGVTYDDLPVITVIDTSPDQMIGCIVTVADNPQGRLDALFPSAIDGDGVIDRATNDIWVYDGAVWNNVGPTPGEVIVETAVIPPWDETVLATARTRTKLEALSLAYALELLTEPEPITTFTSLLVRSAPAYIKVGVTDFAVAAYAPFVAGGASVRPAALTAALAAEQVSVSSGVSIAVPLTEIVTAASEMPYAGPFATVLQVPQAQTIETSAYSPVIQTGVNIAVPTADISTAFNNIVIVSKPPPSVVVGNGGANGLSVFVTVPVETNDIVLLFIETGPSDTPQTPIFQGTTPPTFSAIPGSALSDGGSKFQAWWARAASTDPIAYVECPDPGNHQLVKSFVIKGCTTTGDPYDVVATSTKTVASTTATAPSVTTTVGNCRVLSAISRDNDSSSTAEFSTPINGVLSDFTDHGESGTSIQNGGGFVVFSGTKQVPGETGVSTTTTFSSVVNCSFTIAFKP